MRSTKAFLIVVAFLLVLALMAGPSLGGSQECENQDGSSRDCTVMEELDECLEAAVDAADQRAETDEGGSIILRFLEFSIDVSACALAAISPFH